MKELLRQIENWGKMKEDEINLLKVRLERQNRRELQIRADKDKLHIKAYVIRQKIKRVKKLLTSDKIDIANTLLQEIEEELKSMYANNRT